VTPVTHSTTRPASAILREVWENYEQKVEEIADLDESVVVVVREALEAATLSE
jgi:hypothetical protein